MATLTSPVSKQNIVDRFADYVVATANASIIWGTNTPLPFAEFDIGFFGGTTAGMPIAINGTSISDTQITAATIVSVLKNETARYTTIRRLRARKNITGLGRTDHPSLVTFPVGIVYDQTNKAYMTATTYTQTITTSSGNVLKDSVISATNLETFFTNLQTAYTVARDNVASITVDVCHASCHSSCHSSRGRR